MSSELQELTEKCLCRAKEFDNWIARNVPKRVGTRHELSFALADQVRKRCRELKNLNLAASMPVAVAVYGASQALWGARPRRTISRTLKSKERETDCRTKARCCARSLGFHDGKDLPLSFRLPS